MGFRSIAANQTTGFQYDALSRVTSLTDAINIRTSRLQDARLLLLADVLTCDSKASHGHLLKLLEELTPNTSSDIKLVLEKIAALEPER